MKLKKDIDKAHKTRNKEKQWIKELQKSILRR